LRSVVRQDPNIIMVGEIRDVETALLAVNAALTGHLVLTTIHTSAASAVPARLFDMGVPPYLVASTLRLVISQRLIRKNCPKCSIEKMVSPDEAGRDYPLFSTSSAETDAGVGNIVFREGRGCHFCNSTGYSGRTIIAETMSITGDLARVVAEKIPTPVVETVAIKQGMTTMRDNAWAKVRAGVTTVAEVLRVLHG
jgi:type II secretory ATPase GspE/PulE/Tfp pilus assembly ATPase PilB-like protein